MVRTRHHFGSPLVALAGSLLFLGIVSASIQPRATASGLDFESVTDCHFHGATQYCMGPKATEFQVVPDSEATATGTADQPKSYTDCHQHGTDTYCMSPSGGEVQLLGENDEAPQTTSKASGSAAPQITAITSCHMSSSSVYCMNDGTEYYVQTTASATEDVPAQFTGCHSHGDETYCLTEDDEVAITLAEDVESGKTDPDEKHCHFHAGVEHCVGGSGEEEQSCERTDRDYKIGIRVGMLFVVLVASAVGVFGPILMARFVQIKSNIFLTVLKQFGTGVIISTAFVHLFTHASLMFGNSCLGELKYEATTAAIVMAGLFISFLIEFLVHRAVRWQATKHKDANETYMSPKGLERAEVVNVTIMEAGIIFHSLLIGITLVVAGDSFFITLSIVIIFHQMFEGIALGTRIASLGHGTASSLAASLVNGHMHSHDAPASPVDRSGPSSVSLMRKLIMGAGYAIVTPIGMAIGIGVLHNFNGNDKSTLIALGTLDALSAGILIWVGLVEMWAHDWMLGGELTNANGLTTGLAMFGLITGMVLMSLLGKWA